MTPLKNNFGYPEYHHLHLSYVFVRIRGNKKFDIMCHDIYVAKKRRICDMKKTFIMMTILATLSSASFAATVNNDAFSGQSKVPSNILDNIVYIQGTCHDKQHDEIFGTGSIIHSSHGQNKILTSYHLLHDGEKFKIYDHYGHYLGNGSFMEPDRQNVFSKIEEGDEGFAEHDAGIMDVTDKQPLYDTYKGLSIAPGRPLHYYKAHINTPFGIAQGASGSPVLDENYNIIGIVAGIGYSNGIVSYKYKKVTIPNMNYQITGQGNSMQVLKERAGDDALFTPISNDVLKKLDINIKDSKFQGSKVTIPGYPDESAIIYTGVIK